MAMAIPAFTITVTSKTDSTSQSQPNFTLLANTHTWTVHSCTCLRLGPFPSYFSSASPPPSFTRIFFPCHPTRPKFGYAALVMRDEKNSNRCCAAHIDHKCISFLLLLFGQTNGAIAFIPIKSISAIFTTTQNWNDGRELNHFNFSQYVFMIAAALFGPSRPIISN